MSDSTVKIVEVGKVFTTKAGDVELAYKVEVVHEDVTYFRTIKFISHAEYIHHIGSPIAPEDVERLALMRLDEVKSLHDTARHYAKLVGVDMVATIKDRLVEPIQ